MEVLVCYFCGAQMQIIQPQLEYNFPCPQCKRMVVVLHQEVKPVEKAVVVRDEYHVGINFVES